MSPGDLVRNKNSESGELGLFVSIRFFRPADSPEGCNDYEHSEVYWPMRRKIGKIKTAFIEVVNEAR